MRLLFDENLSPRLVTMLSDIWPDCESVLTSSLGGSADDARWSYAASGRLLIVSKDLDFAERAMLSSVVKVVWIRLRNCTTESVHRLLRENAGRHDEFLDSKDFLIELP